MSMSLIPAGRQKEWMAVLDRCTSWDVYHTPQYHALAQALGEGEPHLFAFERDGEIAALPFLLRSFARLDGIGEPGWHDATSVYGYPGPVTSLAAGEALATGFAAAFQQALLEALGELRCVTLFTRLNPLVPNACLLADVADVQEMGTTVALDVSAPDTVQLAGMSKGHRYDIRRARKDGVVVREDVGFAHLAEFIAMYYETMDRTNARAYYYFPARYFALAKELLGDELRLYFAESGGRRVAGSMFFECNDIVEYHLSGTPTAYLHLGGSKLIIDHVRQRASTAGRAWLHLGGGVSANENDPLFRFKGGFSRHRLPFQVARLVADEAAYSRAVADWRTLASVAGKAAEPGSYFPAYRTPRD